MVKEGFGHIVNINSVRGKGGFYDRTVYCSTKFAMFGLMDSIRYEVLHDYGGSGGSSMDQLFRGGLPS